MNGSVGVRKYLRFALVRIKPRKAMGQLTIEKVWADINFRTHGKAMGYFRTQKHVNPKSYHGVTKIRCSHTTPFNSNFK
jgi:hypothetical protein